MISPIGWEFRDPLFLLLGVLAPLVYWLSIHIPSSITYSSLVLPDSAQRTARVYFSHSVSYTHLTLPTILHV